MLSKCASKLVCLVLILRQITLPRGYIHSNIDITNASSFRCTLLILYMSRMRRNVNRNVYNAGRPIKCKLYNGSQRLEQCGQSVRPFSLWSWRIHTSGAKLFMLIQTHPHSNVNNRWICASHSRLSPLPKVATSLGVVNAHYSGI